MFAMKLGDGADVEVIGLQSEILALVASRAFAPGYPIELVGACNDVSLSFAGRTVDSKIREDGRFDVRLRLVNLRRGQRIAMSEHFATS